MLNIQNYIYIDSEQCLCVVGFIDLLEDFWYRLDKNQMFISTQPQDKSWSHLKLNFARLVLAPEELINFIGSRKLFFAYNDKNGYYHMSMRLV